MECSLAKPQSDQKSVGLNTQKPGLLPSYPSHSGYGLIGGAYGGLGAGYGAPGLAQVTHVHLCFHKMSFSLFQDRRTLAWFSFGVY